MARNTLDNSSAFCVLFLLSAMSLHTCRAWPVYGNSVYNQMAIQRQKDSVMSALEHNDENEVADVFGDADLYPLRE